MKSTDFWFIADITPDETTLVVLADDLMDFLHEHTDNVDSLDIEEFYELFEDWIFEGSN